MYYTSQDKETLDAYNAKIVTGENYDGTTTVLWANVVEHHEGGMFAILKHNGYQLIEGFDDDGESLDAPTVEDISDFFPPLEELN
jgi:hypothetical protein